MTSKIVEGKLPCPVCPSSDAYFLYDDGHGHCYSCNYHYQSKREEEFITLEYTYEYLPFRGLNANTLRFYDIKTKINSEGKPIAVGFRYPNGSYKVRKLDEKEFYWELSSGQPTAGLFGRDRFSAGSNKFVTITEGELDAASLHQVLRTPVVSVNSSSTAVRDVSADFEWLSSFDRVYLAFDDDAPGRDATAAVAKLFDYNKVFVVKFAPRKDANDWLREPGGEDELKNIWHNARRFLPANVKSSFEDFRQILKGETKWGVPYPWQSLTSMTYGLRTGESVLITAQEGIGKTEIAHAIEYQLLKETKDAVGAIYLEESERRHLQAIAGLSLAKPVHLPDTGVSSDQVITALEEVIAQDDRLHVYSHFGSDDPDTLLDNIRFMVAGRNVRWVILDHITMAVSGLSGEDERRALDYLSTRLQMMVNELDFGLIIISHVNDFGQTRGSRNIAKVANIRIDLTRDLMNDDAVVRNTTEVKVSKNRFGGKTGPVCKLLFDPNTFTYSEVGGFAANDNMPQMKGIAA